MTGRQTRATAALRRAGVAFTLHDYAHDPAMDGVVASYGRQAADALGVAADRVLKTLLAKVDGQLAVALVPVDASLDLKALAAALGGKRAVLAEPAGAERATGYVLGAISPFGQRRRLPTVLDDSVAAHRTVFVSAGRRGLELELAAADLARVTTAVQAAIARRDATPPAGPPGRAQR